MTHRQTGVSKGFGFVRLQSHDQALACVGGAPHIIEGRTLNVELSNLGKNAAGMPPAPAPAQAETQCRYGRRRRSGVVCPAAV